MGQYMQGTQKSVQAWTVHGLAVKAALQLGLHSKDASSIFSPQEKEIRKRTWYGCVVLDRYGFHHPILKLNFFCDLQPPSSARTLSMTLGRPAAIPDYFVRLDLPTNDVNGDGHIDMPIVDRETFQMSVGFFNSTMWVNLFVTSNHQFCNQLIISQTTI